ncbi:MAG: hypothetical protein IBX43_01620 [Campylobacterales bacterium]|nr:hypothetical protein [Campylobacterales bacterium]
MSAQEIELKISQAKAKLLVDYPYFGNLASRLSFKQNDNIHAFLSDGSTFEYNDDYLKALDLDELGFALSNAAMHTALAHDKRKKGRMSWLWQLATDHAINAMLIENGLDAPLGINVETRFEGMYAEEIYAVLKEEIKNEEFDSNEENDTGFNEENKRQNQESKPHNPEAKQDKTLPKIEADNEYRAIEEESWKKSLDEAAEKFKDELPLGLERFYERQESRVDWRSELYRAIDRHYYHDYTLVPPSKKLLYMGTYLPSLSSSMLRIVVAIDSSGSVDTVLLGEFIAEFEAILLSFSTFEIDLLVCDAKVQSHQHFSSGDKLEYELKGSGGTDFRPVFAYIEEHLFDASLLLYFTDLQGRFPERAPLIETVWVSNAQDEIPFGKKIEI